MPDTSVNVLDAVRECIKRMKPYVPGKSVEYVRKKYGVERVVKLASNENPYGPSPKAVNALKSVEAEKLSVYPETFPSELLSAIEEHTGWERERVVTGAGLDGVMETLFRLLVDPGDKVLLPLPTYPYYHTVIDVFGARSVFTGRKEDYSIDVNNLIEAYRKEKPKLIIICSPNNPTGNAEDEKKVREVIEACEKSVVFIDEAYGEFADFEKKSLKKLHSYENVVIGRTLSKAFGLANLRVGYAVMSEELRREYLKATTPFPVSTPSALAASAALRDREYLNFVLRSTAEERKRLQKELEKLGIKVYDSSANFLFVDVHCNAKNFVEELMKRGVIVRDCSGFPGCGIGNVRITVGKREDNDFLIKAVRGAVNNISGG